MTTIGPAEKGGRQYVQNPLVLRPRRPRERAGERRRIAAPGSHRTASADRPGPQGGHGALGESAGGERPVRSHSRPDPAAGAGRGGHDVRLLWGGAPGGDARGGASPDRTVQRGVRLLRGRPAPVGGPGGRGGDVLRRRAADSQVIPAAEVEGG